MDARFKIVVGGPREGPLKWNLRWAFKHGAWPGGSSSETMKRLRRFGRTSYGLRQTAALRGFV
eukprot:10880605-Alexandrium_andersonii.AAC.1